MGLNKQYDGYQPFEYLEAGEDYEEFDLPSERTGEWGSPYEVPLEDDQESRADRLSEELTIISLHEHAFKFPTDLDRQPAYAKQGRMFTGYEFLADSNLDGVFDFQQNGGLKAHSKNGWKFSEVVYDLGMRRSDIAHQDFIFIAESVDDFERARTEGKLALVPSIESCMPLENEVDRIDVLYGLGIRLMGITYVESNALGTGEGDMPDGDGGLTGFGVEVVERMNKIGMAVSLGHASDRTTLDVCDVSDKPVFLSHNGARSVMNSTRLNTDEGLQAVADTGGVIGINAAPHSTASEDHPRHSIKSVMDHFEYIKDLVGIDHVTFGPDTLYGDHYGLHGRQVLYEVDFDLEQVEYVEGMENPTEAWQNIVRWLVKEGYPDEEIAKVVGGNTLRALEEIWD
ncbi:MAG: dipeptidase [Halobacteriales archaeon]